MKKDLILKKNTPYHVVARAVEGRTIFCSEEERTRFIVQMYAANIGQPGFHLSRRNVQTASVALLHGGEIPQGIVRQEHDPLVTFFSFALVGNHYHFGLIGRFDNAISKYLQKLNGGFARFFNLKHSRVGSLFATRFAAVRISNERQLAVLMRYINIKNVIDVVRPAWEKRGLEDIEQTIESVRQYQYSSFPDLFLGRSSYFISKTNHEMLQEILGEQFLPQGTDKEEIKSFLADKGVDQYRALFLE